MEIAVQNVERTGKKGKVGKKKNKRKSLVHALITVPKHTIQMQTAFHFPV